MKNRILPLLCILCLEVSAIGPTVIEYGPLSIISEGTKVLNIIKTAEETYTSVQKQIAMFEQMKDQTEMQLQSLQNMDFDNIGEAISFLDDKVTFARNMESRVKNATIKIGDDDVRVASMYVLPDITGSFAQTTADLLTTEMTDKEKAKILSYYGLSPENYFYIQQKYQRASWLGQNAAALHQNYLDSFDAYYETMEEITDASEMEENKSVVAQLQLAGQMGRVQTAAIMDLTTMMGNMSETNAMMAYNQLEGKTSERIVTGGSSDFIESILDKEF